MPGRILCEVITQIPGRASAERRFFTGMALAILATIIVGFSRSFFLRPLFPEWPSPSEMIFYVHGVAFTAWIVLLVVQASLVADGRTELHRKIGPFSAVLAVAMVVLGTLGALIAARRDTGFFGITIPPLQFLAVPLFDMILFATFVWLAIAQRRNPQSHKRWMLLATVNLVTAAIARAAGCIQSRYGEGLLIVVSQPLRLVVSSTQGWLVFRSVGDRATRLIASSTQRTS
jgi:hypothetical protein